LRADQIGQLPLANIPQEAVDYIQLHAAGKNIFLSYDPAFEKRSHLDAEGRILAYVWYTTYSSGAMDDSGGAKFLGVTSQQRLLNQELIMMGLALADTESNFVQQQIFLEQEQEAAKTKKGFWRSASEMYEDLMRSAQGSQTASTAGFVGEKAREVSLESAKQAYDKLIQMNPTSYRPYYERSWLGVNAIHDKVTEDNLKDIEKAIELSPFQPKSFLQKYYLLRLLGRYDDSLESYDRAVRLGSKLGMLSAVSDLASAEFEKPLWEEERRDPKKRARALQALRATLNEDHFLFWMARYHFPESEAADEMITLYSKISKMARFQEFEEKYPELKAGDAHAILYRTQWAREGIRNPEGVLRAIETVGETSVVPVEPEKTKTP
jgi:tetratricopeptide (TPR) repeat protein